ncbi:MAG: dihydroorotate dehydrogenase electron transfer subunit, partial [Zetaproteobacteria bacterium]
IYYKIVGQGTEALSQRKPGEALPIMGPIGRPFALDAHRRYLLLGGGVGLPPEWFAAKRLAAMGAAAVLFAGNEAPLPFATRPSTFLLPGVPEDAWLTFEALEEIGIPARIASRAEIPGAFFGFVTELAERWLAAIADDFRERTEILACGPEPMLAAAQKLARAFALPAQLALEARMACAIGGCAGCVVRTRENGRAFYRRVCVDGPVFPAEIVAEWD